MKYGKKNRTVDLLLHMGAGSGWRSFWMAIPDYNVGIVIFSNYGSINTTILPEVIAYKFVDTYFNLSNYDWSAQQKKIKDTLQKRMDDVHANYVAAPSIHPKDVAGFTDTAFMVALELKNSTKGFMSVSEVNDFL